MSEIYSITDEVFNVADWLWSELDKMAAIDSARMWSKPAGEEKSHSAEETKPPAGRS
jgi:hypothetical protein